MRVIDSEGKNLGVMKREEALTLAAEGEVDLIEVAAAAKPPVVRLMNFDKFRYEREKAEKKEKKAQRGGDSKQVQISARAQKNDLLVKLKKLEEFLGEGHPVEIKLVLRGREKAHPEWAEQKLREFLGMITLEYRTISAIRRTGNGFGVSIFKK